MSVDSKAKDLAQELLNNKKTEFQTIIPIKNSNEVFVVSVVRIQKQNSELLTKQKAVENFRYIASAPGSPCPRCGGSGKV